MVEEVFKFLVGDAYKVRYFGECTLLRINTHTDLIARKIIKKTRSHNGRIICIYIFWGNIETNMKKIQ